jgi:hypothetical protein
MTSIVFETGMGLIKLTSNLRNGNNFDLNQLGIDSV